MSTSERIMVLVLMALVALALSGGAQAQLLGQPSGLKDKRAPIIPDWAQQAPQ